MRARLGTVTSTAIVYGVLLVAIVVGAILTAANGRNFFSVGNIDNILTTHQHPGLHRHRPDAGDPRSARSTSRCRSWSAWPASSAAGSWPAESGNIVPAVLVALAAGAW